jgi:hypothetical protein
MKVWTRIGRRNIDAERQNMEDMMRKREPH